MNILILTSAYKDDSLGNIDSSTNIVNSFAHDWVKQGHKVIVVHNSHCYPRLIHYIPKLLKRKLASIMGFSIADYVAVQKKEYKDDGVLVYRLPLKKYFPHKSPSKSVIKKQVNEIENILKLNNFTPDIITGHWISPQIEIIYKLKDIYNCKTALVLHGIGYLDNHSFDVKKYLTNVDSLGCRSKKQAQSIMEILDLKNEPFICYSGVPDKYIEKYNLNIQKFKNIKKWRISFVGRLVAYKNVDVIIKALSNIEGLDWELNIVGEGAEKENLISLAKKLKCLDRINFYGKIPRNQVMEILKETHMFIMASTNEIFGLVYLEAMAASCITIASRDGGMDGIILDNENGFLCLEGSDIDLEKKIREIIRMNDDKIESIINKGYITAVNYTDSKVAHRYLKEISSTIQ